jgi:hypothetical protein
MPSVGHPLLLAAFCVILKISPATFTWFFFVASFILLSIATWIYSRSNIILILALWLYCEFFSHIEWLSANVESSIIFANLLLVASLAIFYKTGFSKRWAIVSGCALFIHILMRPIFLFPAHFCLAGCIVMILYYYIRKHVLLPSQFVKGWFIVLITAESLVFMTYVYSYLRYQDSRLATGTYGALALYAGNNIYEPTKGEFLAGSRHSLEFLKKINIVKYNPGTTWRQRHEMLTQEVIAYWKQYPWRAFEGWRWRFGQFMGIYAGAKGPYIAFQAFSALALPILVLARVLIGILQRKEESKLKNSFGLVCAAMFFAYSAIHAVFAYSAFRYASVALVLLIPAVTFLLFEINVLLNKNVMAILTSSNRRHS